MRFGVSGTTPKTKHQSTEWRSPASPRRKKVGTENRCSSPFLCSQGIIRKEFLPEGRTRNVARFTEILTHFMKRLRVQYAQHGFLYTTMLAFTELKQFLAKKGEKKRKKCKIGEIGNGIEEVVDLARQTNLEVNGDDVQEVLDTYNEQLTMDELIEMHEQKKTIEEFVSFYLVQSEDRMMLLRI
ncbi:hypothetical protein TNCV_1424121 [Trichonephila clavipes]|nr:hypothetical protein TNCV_1424121 [Trichonephila clavipes]